MKRALRLVLSLALLLCIVQSNAQRRTNYNVLTDVKTKEIKGNRTPEVKVMDNKGAVVVYLIDEYHFPYDVSDNGQHVAIQGFGESTSYYWSEATGIVPMDGMAFAISDNGVIAGYFMKEDLGANVAGMWFPDVQQWSFLGMNPDAPTITDMEYNSAWAMTNDGSTLCVMQVDAEWNTISYLWTEADGYQILNHAAPSWSSRAMAISSDARVVAGHGCVDLGWTPCYWIDGTFHHIDENTLGEAMAVSDNGNYIAGYYDGMPGQAFIYDIANDVLSVYEDETGETSLSATCVANNGDAFGYSSSGFPPMPDMRRAFAISGNQLMTFNEYLAINGFEEAANWTFYSINSVTASGKTFSGAANIDGVDYSFILTIDESDCDGPTDLTYTIEDNNYDDVILNWNAPENPVDVTYEIYTGYTSQEPLVAGITETTYTIEDLEPGTYNYIVKANWGGECLSSGSNAVSPKIYSCPPSQMCNLTVELSDEYGDGWNGAYMEIKGADGNLLHKVELNNGYNLTIELPFCNDQLTFTWVSGEWDNEIGFIISKDGEVLYSIESITEPLGTFFEYEIMCYDNVEEIENETSVTIAPNPANTYFNIAAENISKVEIINALGQTVELINVDDNNVQVNTTDYDNGVYFVKVITSDAQATVKKIVVSK